MEVRSRGLRVYLKSTSMEDVDALEKKCNDYELMHNIPTFPFPYKRSDAISFVEHVLNEERVGAGRHFGIHLIDSGELIGGIAIGKIDRKNRCAEVGYWLEKDSRGKGYVKEALRLILNFGFYKLKLNRVSARAFPYNERSIRSLTRIGFSKEGMSRESQFHEGKFNDEINFSMLQKEFKDKLKLQVANE